MLKNLRNANPIVPPLRPHLNWDRLLADTKHFIGHTVCVRVRVLYRQTCSGRLLGLSVEYQIPAASVHARWSWWERCSPLERPDQASQGSNNVLCVYL